jgi:quercetin dioxygenase-like cupin family protein
LLPRWRGPMLLAHCGGHRKTAHAPLLPPREIVSTLRFCPGGSSSEPFRPRINGKFKLRATEVTFAPGAYLGVHHHVGPGIRYVLSGEVAFTEGGETTMYKAGDYFFETGNLAHTAENRTNLPLRVLFVEILPKDWAGAPASQAHPLVNPPKPA